MHTTCDACCAPGRKAQAHGQQELVTTLAGHSPTHQVRRPQTLAPQPSAHQRNKWTDRAEAPVPWER